MPDESKRRWELPGAPTAHSLPWDMPTAVAKVLVNRGVDTAEKLRLVIDPPQQLPYNPQ